MPGSTGGSNGGDSDRWEEDTIMEEGDIDIYTATTVEDEATQSLGRLRLMEASPDASVTVDEYIAELSAAARASQEHGTQQYMREYYGEFYDDEPGQFYYGEWQEADRAAVRQVGQGHHDGDMVASAATNLSGVSVRLSELTATRGEGAEIPFQEQDDPPDFTFAGCPDGS